MGPLKFDHNKRMITLIEFIIAAFTSKMQCCALKERVNGKCKGGL